MLLELPRLLYLQPAFLRALLERGQLLRDGIGRLGRAQGPAGGDVQRHLKKAKLRKKEAG